MQKKLNGEWRLYMSETERKASRESELSDIKPIIAIIPESLEATLERLGILPNPYVGLNFYEARKYERYHLWYARDFEYVSGGGEPTICFEGIDTVSEVFLNGEKLGDTDNAFIPHEFAACGIKEGRNELLLHIIPSAVLEEKTPAVWKNGIPNYCGGSVSLRKPAFNHGWDVFPRLMCGAIWKDAYLEEKAESLIGDVYLYTKKLAWRRATVCAKYDTADGGEIKIDGVCGPSGFSATAKSGKETLEIEIRDPLLWAPKGMGKPNLYSVMVTFMKDGEAVEKKELCFGIRTVELKRTSVSDKEGNGEFCFYMSGNRMYAIGTNYVPTDAVLSRMAERTPRALAALDDIGCNCVRVWGGGVYESDEFYDFCDTHGIAVWQDFMMACAVYPETDEYCENLRREAEYTVRRLRNHPCIMLWAGDNECDVLRTSWYDEKLNPEENKLTRKVLPQVLEKLDNTRPYIPSSPYIDGECFEKGAGLSSENHLWRIPDFWTTDYYMKTPAHFVSEVGFWSAPSANFIRKFITPDEIDNRTGQEWTMHTGEVEEGQNNQAVLLNNCADFIFGEKPETLEDFVFASQIFQAESQKRLMESFLAQKWRRTGVIWWNLLSGWPQFDNSLVAYNFERKIGYDFVKRLQLPLTILIGEKCELRVINNTENETYVEYNVTDVGSGKLITSGALSVGYNSNTRVEAVEPPKEKGDVYLIEWSYRSSGIVGEHEGKNHYISGIPPYNRDKYVRLMKSAGLIK